jgi:hypothetical protein
MYASDGSRNYKACLDVERFTFSRNTFMSVVRGGAIMRVKLHWKRLLSLKVLAATCFFLAWTIEHQQQQRLNGERELLRETIANIHHSKQIATQYRIMAAQLLGQREKPNVELISMATSEYARFQSWALQVGDQALRVPSNPPSNRERQMAKFADEVAGLLDKQDLSGLVGFLVSFDAAALRELNEQSQQINAKFTNIYLEQQRWSAIFFWTSIIGYVLLVAYFLSSKPSATQE